MKPIPSPMTAALVAAACLAAGSVMAQTQDAPTTTQDAQRPSQTMPSATPSAAERDRTAVVPDRSDLNPGAMPTTRSLDDNAQRQHDPDRAAGKATGANRNDPMMQNPQSTGAREGVSDRSDLNTAPTTRSLDDNAQRQHDPDRATRGNGTAAERSQSPHGGGTTDGRDWSQIDTNRDNLIQPEEMEAWLKKSGSQPKTQK